MGNRLKQLLVLLCFFYLQSVCSQVLLDADGPGNTYALITSVLAPGNNPIEVPDCNHAAFGEHIDEIFDNDLNSNVFRFHIHVMPDNDRCTNSDRQRNEIKTYDRSPENLLGIANETVVYKWKFKLASGFQSSPNFTHLHQLKSVGGSLESMPMYTLTTRKGSPDRLELRYAAKDTQVTLAQSALTPFIDTWLEVTETIKYGTLGTYDIKIKRVNDGTILFAYTNDAIINWRAGADFVRPKWGIYRSLANAQDLRDEAVLFANFSIEELEIISTSVSAMNDDMLNIIPNPVKDRMYLKNLPKAVKSIQIFSLDGRKVMDKPISSAPEFNLDVSSFPDGAYIIHLMAEQLSQSKMILISR